MLAKDWSQMMRDDGYAGQRLVTDDDGYMLGKDWLRMMTDDVYAGQRLVTDDDG